jgi:hypothetical protein
MANFLQQNSSPFGEIKPYAPDYGFLMQVYGTRQAEYDRGFEAVKSLYTSQLNSAMTNEGNEAHRQEIFKKLQSSLRSVAGVDLSQAANINKASSLMDPISKDRDLAYDMGFTAFSQKQRATMNQYKNSTDFKMRSLYSQESEEDIANAEADMKAAKRGDGSMQRVTPREFTPVEDTNEYLRKTAKEEGIEISFDSANQGYIVSQVNGKNSYGAFQQWAKTALGNKFDRQFAMQGRVQAERMVRGTMSQKGLSRADAVKVVAQQITGVMQEKNAVKGVKSEEIRDEHDVKIQQFQKSFPNGVPASKLEYYDKLIAERDAHKEDSESARGELQKLNTDGAAYVGANLHGIFAQEAKSQAADKWAKAHADATAKVSLAPDQVVLTKMKIASDQAMTRLKISSDQAISAANRAQKDRQFNMSYDLNVEKLKISMSGVKPGDPPSEEAMGSYLGTSKITAIDLGSRAMQEGRADMFSTAFSKTDGLMNTIIGGEEATYTYAVLNKMQAMENGRGSKLSAQDIKVLGAYAKKIGLRIPVPTTAGTASEVLKQLSIGTYQAALTSLKNDAGNKATRKNNRLFDSFAGNYSAMSNYIAANKVYEKDNASLARVLLTKAGTVKEMYQDQVTIKGYTQEGTPLFDMSKATAATKNSLSNFVNKEMGTRTRASGNLIKFNNLKASELEVLLNNNSGGATATDSQGKPYDLSLLNRIAGKTLQTALASSANGGYDPIAKTVTFQLKMDVTNKALFGSGATAKAPLSSEPVTITVPYSTIQNNPALARFAKHIPANSILAQSNGQFSKFATDQFAVVNSPTYMDNTGFKYTAGGGINTAKQYGVQLNFLLDNPATGRKEPFDKFVVGNPNDPEFFAKIESIVNDAHTNYLLGRTGTEDQINNQDSNSPARPY